jgi:uncharacterized protein involved in response to NO
MIDTLLAMLVIVICSAVGTVLGMVLLVAGILLFDRYDDWRRKRAVRRRMGLR